MKKPCKMLVLESLFPQTGNSKEVSYGTVYDSQSRSLRRRALTRVLGATLNRPLFLLKIKGARENLASTCDEHGMGVMT